MLSTFDYLIVGFIALYSILHLRKKLIVNICSFIKNILSFLVALFITKKLLNFINIRISAFQNEYSELIIFISTFITIYVFLAVIFLILKMIAEISFASIIEKPLDLFIGIINGVIVSVIFIYSLLLIPQIKECDISKKSFSVSIIKELQNNENIKNDKKLFLFEKIKIQLEKMYSIAELNNNK